MGGSLRSGMDHVPGTGPHRVGMVTPSVESLHNPTQFGFDSTLDAVSRHCEKKLRCQIQSCLDVIKHFLIFLVRRRLRRPRTGNSHGLVPEVDDVVSES